MASLKGTRTEANLRRALARESEANRRYLWFAEQADIEGRPDAAALFRSLADGETAHAFGHLEYLVDLGDVDTGRSLDGVDDYLQSAIAGKAYDSSEMYPEFARLARDEGFEEIGLWMESLAKAEGAQLAKLTALLDGESTDARRGEGDDDG